MTRIGRVFGAIFRFLMSPSFLFPAFMIPVMIILLIVLLIVAINYQVKAKKWEKEKELRESEGVTWDKSRCEEKK